MLVDYDLSSLVDTDPDSGFISSSIILYPSKNNIIIYLPVRNKQTLFCV